MAIGDYVLPNSLLQNGEPYQLAIDGAAAVHAKIAGLFVVQEAAVPDLTLRVLPGQQFVGAEVVSQDEQSVDLAPAPIGNGRIDRVVLNATTLVAEVVTGTPDPDPVAPALPASKIPLALVAVADGATILTNGVITDDRVLGGAGGGDWAPIAGNPFGLSGAGVANLGTIMSGLDNKDVMVEFPDLRCVLDTDMKIRAITTGGVVTTVVYRDNTRDDAVSIDADAWGPFEQVDNVVGSGLTGRLMFRRPGSTAGFHFVDGYVTWRDASTGNFRSHTLDGGLFSSEKLVGLQFDPNGQTWAAGAQVEVFAR